jgi:hypothetical protein
VNDGGQQSHRVPKDIYPLCSDLVKLDSSDGLESHKMNFFPLPQSHIRTPAETYYICGAQGLHPFLYDGGDWLNFPRRMGRDEEDLYVKFDDTESTLSSKRSFLQAWLFFGLLLEFLGQEDAGQETFVEVQNGQGVVSWIVIQEHLLRWTSRVQNSSQDSKTRLKTRLDELSVDAGPYIVSFCDGQHDNSPLKDADALSILLLASLLELAKANVSAHLVKPQRIPTRPPESLLATLSSQNWCPGDIARIGSTLTTLWAIYYLSLLGPSRPDAQHWECNNRRCSAYHVDDKSYLQRHATGCTCHNFMSADARMTENLILSDQVPLVLAQTPRIGRPQIEVHHFEEGVKDFVAISHVWSDGLGNPFGNYLPRCQVEQIQQWCDEILPRGLTGQSTLFWMDTLCIPLANPAKRKAIKSMVKVYSLAKAVLVIDQDLLKIPMHIPDLELGARIYSCGWLRRVWTLQEAARSQNLYFRLRDGFVHLETLVRRVSEPLTSDVPFDPARHLAAEFLIPLATINSIAGDVSRGVGVAINAVQFRDTTNEGDEIACINGILGWEEEEVMPSETSQQIRLQRVFLRQTFIQSDFLFLSGRRMTERGWRWAPAKLTQQSSFQITGPLTSTATIDGLHGIYHGIRIIPVPGATLRSAFTLYDQHYDVWLVVSDLSITDTSDVLIQEVRPQIKLLKGGWIDGLRRPAILLQHRLPREGGTTSTVGVLVDIEDERDGVYHALFCGSVSLALLPGETVQAFKAMMVALGGPEELANANVELLRVGNGVSKDQKWCIS